MRPKPMRRVAWVWLLTMVAAPSIAGTCAPGPETTQGPLWSTSAFAASSSTRSVAAGETDTTTFTVDFLLPQGSDSGWTGNLNVNLYFDEDAPTSVKATLWAEDGLGMVALEELVADVPAAEFPDYELNSGEFLTACVAGERCTGSLTMEVIVSSGQVRYSWDAGFTARDNEVGADPAEVEASLVGE